MGYRQETPSVIQGIELRRLDMALSLFALWFFRGCAHEEVVVCRVSFETQYLSFDTDLAISFISTRHTKLAGMHTSDTCGFDLRGERKSMSNFKVVRRRFMEVVVGR
jgi:hypothetical protein